MAFSRFLIAPMNSGLVGDERSWLIPDDAFASLNNAYMFRGRVRKRFGTKLMNTTIAVPFAQLNSRLRIKIGTTNGSGNFTGTVPGSVFAVGQLFSVATDIYTVYQMGTPASMLISGIATVATYNTTTGAVVINGAPITTAVYFYPATPVMGFITYQTAASTNDPVYAFDTQFAYQYSSGGWSTLPATPPSSAPAAGIWSGDDDDFFWGTTWQGATSNIRYLFVTNNNPPDLIQYWNGSAWTILNPVILGGGSGTLSFLTTALLLIVFKNRLTAFNTTETSYTGSNVGTTTGSGTFSGTVSGGAIGQYFAVGNSLFKITAASGALTVLSGTGTGTYDTVSGALTLTGVNPSSIIYYYNLASSTMNVFTNRARYAAFGDPTSLIAWRQDIPGQGNAIDAATMEDIVSCEFVKDRVVIFFERSTWEFVYNSNQAQPFTWRQLNTELGAESTHSIVPFDKYCLGIANVGVHACNGVNVERIDNKIPDEIWDIHDGQAEVSRIAGIRDYFVEQVYWTFPNVDAGPFSNTYPNRVLVYDYKKGSWAFNDDSITAFGYYYEASDNTSTTSWASENITWQEVSVTWGYGGAGENQALNQEIIAGNQEGFTFRIDADEPTNCMSLQVTNITLVSNQVNLNVINHNFNNNDYVYLQTLNGLTPVAPYTVFVGIYQITSITDENNFIISAPDILASLAASQVYVGGATITRVSKIDFLTKQFNFFVKQMRNSYIQKVDCLVDRTTNGQITVDYRTGTSWEDNLPDTVSGTLVGTNVLETTPYTLYPQEANQDRLWHPVYFQGNGNAVQFHFYLSPAQLTNINVVNSDFQLHALAIYATPTDSRLM